MKKRGFTLIELVVVIALIAILAVVLAPKLRYQRAKAEDANAIAVLGAMRTSSITYYADNGVKPYGLIPPVTVNDFQDVQEDDKAGLDLLIPQQSRDAMKMFGGDGSWEPGDEYTLKIGGSRESAIGDVFLEGRIGFTFSAPAGASADGVSLWFTQKTVSPVNYEFDTKRNRWIEY